MNVHGMLIIFRCYKEMFYGQHLLIITIYSPYPPRALVN